MSAIKRPQLNRIPGGDMPLAKKESHIKDLSKLTLLELQEIKEREEKLLLKAKLLKLPDKGKRIRDFYEKVVKELERRLEIDEAAKLFSDLNIASHGENKLNELEWQGKLENCTMDPLNDVLDSDDESEMDPLKIIAQAQMHKRKTKIIMEAPSLITEQDLKEITHFKAGSPDSGVTIESAAGFDASVPRFTNPELDVNDIYSPRLNSISDSLNTPLNNSRSSSACSQTAMELEPHVNYLVEITELNIVPATKDKFKPYQTTITNVHDPEKEKIRKKGKHWEVTAATPPLIQHNGTQLIGLLDSVEIQTQYLAKLKVLQEKQAEDRLLARLKRMDEHKVIKQPSSEELKTKSFTHYRSSKLFSENHIEGDQKYNENDEVHDPLDEQKTASINYTVYE